MVSVSNTTVVIVSIHELCCCCLSWYDTQQPLALSQRHWPINHNSTTTQITSSLKIIPVGSAAISKAASRLFEYVHVTFGSVPCNGCRANRQLYNIYKKQHSVPAYARANKKLDGCFQPRTTAPLMTECGMIFDSLLHFISCTHSSIDPTLTIRIHMPLHRYCRLFSCDLTFPLLHSLSMM